MTANTGGAGFVTAAGDGRVSAAVQRLWPDGNLSHGHGADLQEYRQKHSPRHIAFRGASGNGHLFVVNRRRCRALLSGGCSNGHIYEYML